MFWKKKKEEVEEPEVDLSIEDVRQVIMEAASDLPLAISLRSLVNDDYSIDFSLLKSKIKGVPSQPFYMSKETFEVFEAPEQAKLLDDVQRAVDQFVKEKDELPVIPGDPHRKISYFMIKDYLHGTPQETTYLSKHDNLVTHRRPIN
ncbi:DUF3939 domain-containing protein [Bacillus alkalicellulosilyticus]|uniref:DUF3939 domain-containing protein n=1 Tax=Alkalihalobacterium alkalicellulosilyticum TaxID=1912214 RepID=UPI000996AB19|nr:DUF3939 domain-containing protein [Bacillus alkalicellulosilyticus]